MMPSHHGYIVWVFRGFEKDKFGHFFGFYNSLGCIIGMAKDIPIYIILMNFYLKKLIFNDFDYEFTFIQEYLLSLVLIFIGAILNIANIRTLGNSTIIFAFITMLPFFIGFLITLPATNPSTWMDTTPQNEDKEYQFGLFLASMVWLHTGLDCTGCLSAEIGFKKDKFFNAFVVAIVVNYFCYTLPVLGALTQECHDDNCWDDGYLYTAYNAISPALGYAVAVSGFFSNFALYVAEMSVQARAFWAISQPFVLLTKSGKMYVETDDNLFYNEDMEIVDIEKETDVHNIRRITIGMLPKWACGTIWGRTGAPVRGVILQSLICCVLVLFDFEFLLQATVLINCVTWCIELISFLRLRYTEPDTPRPYKVPGGLFVAWFITLDKCLLVAVLFVLVIRDHPYYIFVTLGFFAFTVIYYFFYMKRKKLKNASKALSEMVLIKTTENES